MIQSRVFVLNCGSSSLKYSLLDPAGEGTTFASGTVERIGAPAGPSDHEAALLDVISELERRGPRLRDPGLVAVAHRVVHGGTRFIEPVVVDNAVLAEIRELSPLAPLHNPINATGIEVARRTLPDVPHVAVFDTAFHHSLPPRAYTYAVPQSWARDYHVRRYGFHGTSHAFVTRRAAAVLGRSTESCNLIVLHLGNGASATAVHDGRSVDTSMGLTPLEGLVMGSRSGDLDPAVVAYLWRAGLDVAAIDDTLNSASGMLGLSGEMDMRDVHRRIEAGDQRAALALDVYCHRIRKYVGAYYAVLGRVHGVVFTAGVGENDLVVRARSLDGLQRLGIAVDHARNHSSSRDARLISPDGAEVAVLVVPTDEELEMARQAAALVAGSDSVDQPSPRRSGLRGA